MLPSLEALRAARLAALDGALSALLRDAVGQEIDGIQVSASSCEGQSVIDVTYTKNGMPVTGFDL